MLSFVFCGPVGQTIHTTQLSTRAHTSVLTTTTISEEMNRCSPENSGEVAKETHRNPLNCYTTRCLSLYACVMSVCVLHVYVRTGMSI